MRQPSEPRNQRRVQPSGRIGSWRGVALGLALASCALNPVTKAPEISFTSLEEEKEAGTQGAAQMAEQIGVMGDDVELARYVKALGARLAANSPRKDIEYTFHVLDSDLANAFALPAGYIYVSRGLIALLSSEAELAGVLAHQIGHAAARHSSNTSLGAAASGVLSGIGSVAGGVLGIGLLSQIGVLQSIVPANSPDQEEQADKIGQELAFEAGWDATGISAFIRAYERSLRRDKTSLETGFLLVHPSSSERIEAIRERAAKLGTPPPSPDVLDRAAFLAKLRGLVIGQDARAGVFDAKVPTLFLQPDLDFRIRFPEGWTTLNAPSFVAGADPGGRITLEPAGEGSDLKKAASEYAARNKKQAEEKGGKEPELVRTKAGMRMLARKRASYVVEGTIDGGRGTVLQYWIEVPPNIYRLTCVMATQAKSQYVNECRRTAATLGKLRRKERESIRQTTLEVSEARAGETLEDFNERVGNAWGIDQTAAVNGLSLPYTLRAGQPLKYALAKPYQPARADPGPDPDPEPETEPETETDTES